MPHLTSKQRMCSLKRILFFMSIGTLTFISGVAAHALALRSTPPSPVPEASGVPVTSLNFEPGAPISIGRITRANDRFFDVELLNVSGKAIVSFAYTYYRECATDTLSGGGGISFTKRLLGPGDKLRLMSVNPLGSGKSLSKTASIPQRNFTFKLRASLSLMEALGRRGPETAPV